MFALQDRNDIDKDLADEQFVDESTRIISLATDGVPSKPKRSEGATRDPAHVNWDVARCRDDEVAAALRDSRPEMTSLLELFFSDSIPDIRAAKAICQDCTLIEPCLSFATERREPWGVWGGQLFQNGKVLAVKRPRGRPPKNPARQLTA